MNIFMALILLTNINAQRTEDFVGQTIRPLSMKSAIATTNEIPNRKDEFETTDAYERRLSKSLAGIADTLVIRVPLDMQFVTYNADNQQLEIIEYAVHNENVDYSNVFGYGSDGVDLNIEYDSLNNIDLVVSREDVPAGRYQASNSFGVTKTVQRINRRTMAIFEREAQQWELLFTLRREDQLLLGPTVMSIDMPPERARLMKKELAASVVVKLKRPFRAIGHRLVSPTLEEATEINETIDVIIADILYVLITDRSNLVLASFKTR